MWDGSGEPKAARQPNQLGLLARNLSGTRIPPSAEERITCEAKNREIFVS